MKPNEMPQFSKLMTQIASIYGKPMNAMLIEIYWQALQTFDLKVVETAMLSHVKNPDVGQFLEHSPGASCRYLWRGCLIRYYSSSHGQAHSCIK